MVHQPHIYSLKIVMFCLFVTLSGKKRPPEDTEELNKKNKVTHDMVSH